MSRTSIYLVNWDPAQCHRYQSSTNLNLRSSVSAAVVVVFGGNTEDSLKTTAEIPTQLTT